MRKLFFFWLWFFFREILTVKVDDFDHADRIPDVNSTTSIDEEILLKSYEPFVQLNGTKYATTSLDHNQSAGYPLVIVDIVLPFGTLLLVLLFCICFCYAFICKRSRDETLAQAILGHNDASPPPLHLISFENPAFSPSHISPSHVPPAQPPPHVPAFNDSHNEVV